MNQKTDSAPKVEEEYSVEKVLNKRERNGKVSHKKKIKIMEYGGKICLIDKNSFFRLNTF